MEFTNGVDSNKVGYALAKFIYNFDKLGAIRIFDMNVTSAKSSGSSECYFAKGYRYYNKETWARDDVREVFLRRAHWDKRRDEPYYMTMFEYRSPRLKWLLKNDYYILY